jgi:transcriptional regulator with XRE-family HTH domain
MQATKRNVLEAAGWKFGDAADFLAMTNDERQMLDLRVEAALAVKRQRKAMRLSQQQLAARLKTSQPRIVKIEHAAPDVTLDQILRAFTAAGGRISLGEVSSKLVHDPHARRHKSAKAGRKTNLRITLIANDARGTDRSVS